METPLPKPADGPPRSLAQWPAADPTEILRLRDGLYAVELLGAALSGLDCFTRLARAPADLPTLCRDLQIHPRPADVMLTLFAAMGLVQARDGRFGLTELGRTFLVQDSPWFLGPYYAALKDRPVCQDMLKVLRTGRPANWGSFRQEQEWARAMEREDFARTFTAAMDCRGAYLGPALARSLDLGGHTHVLDIAGGSGVYACALAARHPHVRATVLEKPPVDRIAAAEIARRGFADRVAVVIGDMFREALPAGCDAHLFSNVLHDWDEPVVRELLAKSAAALPPGGLIIIHDAHLDREKTGPLPVAAYSTLLMAITEGRCYSVGEMEAYLRDAGFTDVRFQPTAADRSVITARKAD